MHWDIGGFTPSSIEVVAAFDVDKRKIGKVSTKIFSLTVLLSSALRCLFAGVKVRMGKVLMVFQKEDYNENDRLCSLQKGTERKSSRILKETGAEILLNYLPVGSEEATLLCPVCP